MENDSLLSRPTNGSISFRRTGFNGLVKESKEFFLGRTLFDAEDETEDESSALSSHCKSLRVDAPEKSSVIGCSILVKFDLEVCYVRE